MCQLPQPGYVPFILTHREREAGPLASILWPATGQVMEPYEIGHWEPLPQTCRGCAGKVTPGTGPITPYRDEEGLFWVCHRCLVMRYLGPFNTPAWEEYHALLPRPYHEPPEDFR